MSMLIAALEGKGVVSGMECCVEGEMEDQTWANSVGFYGSLEGVNSGSYAFDLGPSP